LYWADVSSGASAGTQVALSLSSRFFCVSVIELVPSPTTGRFDLRRLEREQVAVGEARARELEAPDDLVVDQVDVARAGDARVAILGAVRLAAELDVGRLAVAVEDHVLDRGLRARSS
jgi:hypothetical protein